jgi:choline dehydrogenase-like flavoprotein
MTQVHSGRLHQKPLVLDCDVVIVGSGAGGAVVATMLAEAGLRVVVLEEGPHVPAARHGGMRPSESVRHVWRDAAMTLAFGVGDSPSINVTSGRVIGGSSTLTGGVCFRIPDDVLAEWSGVHGLADMAPAAMDRWFSQVEKDIHVEDVPTSMRSESTKLFIAGGEKLGVEFHPMRRNTRGCDGCGRCNFGCPHGAKMSVDISYLPRAVAAGAEIWSDCLVDKVLIEGDRAVGVEGHVLDGRRGSARSRLTVRAKRVVVAAGGIYSPLVLRRSGVGRRSKQVGRNLALHPSFRMMARFDQPVRGWEGALQSAYSNHFFHSEGWLFNSVFIPNGVLAATLPGFGPSHAKRRAEVSHLAIFGGMLHDDAGGRVWPGLGREPFLTYRMSARDRARIGPMLRKMGEIFFAAGAREVFLPVFGEEPVDADGLRKFPFDRVKGRNLESSSQHPLGTCQMGTSPEHSVVDPEGRAWDVKNLFVADGSILPTSLGVNPQLAIMAMAMRIAWKMRESKPV